MKPEQPWTIGRKSLIGSLVIAHVWGTVLVIAVLRGRESLVIAQMFEAIGFMIFSTLAVLVGGKAWKDFAPMKWGQQQSNNREEKQNDRDTNIPVE